MKKWGTCIDIVDYAGYTKLNTQTLGRPDISTRLHSETRSLIVRQVSLENLDNIRLQVVSFFLSGTVKQKEHVVSAKIASHMETWYACGKLAQQRLLIVLDNIVENSINVKKNILWVPDKEWTFPACQL